MHARHNREPPRPMAPSYSLGDPRVRELREILSQIFFAPPAIVEVLRQADLSPGDYLLEGKASFLWGDILVSAYGRAELEQLLDAAEAHSAARKWRDRIRELRAPEPLVEAAVPPEDDPVGSLGNELILGEVSTLLDVAFLARGVQMAASVVRLTVAWGRRQAYGTGFVIEGGYILTNHHVLFQDGAAADRVQAWFRHEVDVDGLPLVVDACDCDEGSIVGDKGHDWAIISLRKAPRIAVEPLPVARPTKPLEAGDRVYIIQHPLGGYKQIGMHRNVVTRVDEDRVQYLTDTSGGSSGSPVFNDRWEIVALHHRWQAVDPALEESIRARSGETYDRRVGNLGTFRNQGVRIERVIDGLARIGPPKLP